MTRSLQKFKAEQTRLSNRRLNAVSYPKDLTIVAEGDSWFDYPLKKDVIDYLIKRGYAIKKFSRAGDTLENMIYGSAYKKKGDRITHSGQVSLQKTLNAIKHFKPNFVLFSGGGNDIVGPEILGYLNHKHARPAELLNKEIFMARLEQMKIAIDFFIQAVNRTRKSCQILMDGYDYPRINGKGYNFIFKNIKGPWILPAMGAKAITTKKNQKAIMTILVDEFNEMLKSLDQEHSFFHHIDLRNEFPKDDAWDNEIHLKNKGFKRIADLYHNKMCEILHFDPIIKHEDRLIA